MVWDSTLVRAAVELGVVVAVISTCVLLAYRRRHLQELQILRGASLAIGGIAILMALSVVEFHREWFVAPPFAVAQSLVDRGAMHAAVLLAGLATIVAGGMDILAHAGQRQVRISAALRQRLARELTERDRVEHALRHSEERFRVLYDENPSMFFTVDRRGKLLSINQCGADILGYTANELAGGDASLMFRQDDRGLFSACIERCFAQPGTVQEIELRAISRKKHSLWIKLVSRVVTDHAGNQAALVIGDDVTNLRHLSQRLSHQASHDVLTGLVNRREFERRLARVLAADSSESAVCYLDLDKFKLVNDTCGHAAGDELLRQLGKVLRRRIRKRDTVARLGGDEFAVLLEHCALIQARRFADELCTAISSFEFVWEGKQFDLGASIGLVPLTSAPRTLEQVMSDADEACYMAKKLGRNRVYVVEEAQTDQRTRGQIDPWAERLQYALDHDGFRLYQQPIFPVRLDRQKRRHYEVLLRMLDDAGNLLPPAMFIRAAERLGLAPAVDRWVVSQLIRWLSKDDARLESLYLASINLAGASLNDDGFLAFLGQTLAEHREVAAKLCFEIPEGAVTADPEGLVGKMNALQESGCHFALEDFGSGTLPLEYLQHLPVDFVKIDGSFIRHIARDTVDRLMVRTFHDAARKLGKQTIAENVESQAAYEKLLEIGVTYVQGFGLAGPRPLFDDMFIDSPVLVAV